VPGSKKHCRASGDRHVRLVVRVGAGSEELNLSAQARAPGVVQSALKAGAAIPRGQPVRLRREADGDLLPANKRLLDMGITDGDVVIIEPA
jgi:uncharacterized ubiquitin-like protein YukD